MYDKIYLLDKEVYFNKGVILCIFTKDFVI